MSSSLNDRVAREILGVEPDITPSMDFTGSWENAIALAKQVGVTTSVKDILDPEHLVRVALRAHAKNQVNPARHVTTTSHVIEADGGTSCNLPSEGYGYGYGSYQIDNGPIERRDFGKGHSNNSAEIRIIAAALDELALYGDPKKKFVLVRSDSTIALNWVSKLNPPSKKSSELFIEAISILRSQVARFGCVKTEWRGRAHSVALFGH
jgi:ribonuclease HI